jgi:hypothetical protein
MGKENVTFEKLIDVRSPERKVRYTMSLLDSPSLSIIILATNDWIILTNCMTA